MGLRRRLFFGRLLGSGALAAVCGVRAGMVHPRTIDAGPSPELPPVASDRLAADLSAAIAVPTVSIESGGDPAAFEQLRRVLRERFPLVHRELELELVGEHGMLFR
ncbi:MAG TPA: hypothetical protein VFG69_19445, partial [Nannocystaceae bacterium]|nr:hypothetical protein [Nannocystaceae bacterium]